MDQELKQYLDANFARIDEGFVRIDQRFARIDKGFDRIDERFAQIDERFAQIDERFAQIDERFAEIDKDISARIEKVETSLLGAFYGWARPMEIRVDGMTKTVAGFDERLALAERRISELERRRAS